MPLLENWSEDGLSVTPEVTVHPLFCKSVRVVELSNVSDSRLAEAIAGAMLMIIYGTILFINYRSYYCRVIVLIQSGHHGPIFSEKFNIGIALTLIPGRLFYQRGAQQFQIFAYTSGNMRGQDYVWQLAQRVIEW